MCFRYCLKINIVSATRFIVCYSFELGVGRVCSVSTSCLCVGYTLTGGQICNESACLPVCRVYSDGVSDIQCQKSSQIRSTHFSWVGVGYTVLTPLCFGRCRVLNDRIIQVYYFILCFRCSVFVLHLLFLSKTPLFDAFNFYMYLTIHSI